MRSIDALGGKGACPPQIVDFGWIDPVAWVSASCGIIIA